MLNKDKTLKGIPIIEMVRCEVTGKLFPASECEVVVIKIIKSKNADINTYSPIMTHTTGLVQTDMITKEVVQTTSMNELEAFKSTPEFNKAMQKKLSVIPKHMRDIFGTPPV